MHLIPGITSTGSGRGTRTVWWSTYSRYKCQEFIQNLLLILKIQVHCGVKGVVYDGSLSLDTERQIESNRSDAAVPNAVITVHTLAGPLGKNVTTSSRGEFWRLLLPGQYKMTAYQDVCSTGGVVLHSETLNITITEENPLVVQDFVLDRVAPCGSGPR